VSWHIFSVGNHQPSEHRLLSISRDQKEYTNLSTRNGKKGEKEGRGSIQTEKTTGTWEGEARTNQNRLVSREVILYGLKKVSNRGGSNNKPRHDRKGVWIMGRTDESPNNLSFIPSES